MNRRIISKQYALEIKSNAKKTHTPIECGFELTPCCNFNCKMCFVHEIDHSAVRSKELSTEQWISIFDQAYENGMMFALLTGGECLLREDFYTLYLYLWNKGIFVSVNTNAYLIDSKHLSFFKRYPPYLIQITLYGTDDHYYKAVTGISCAQRIKDNIDLLISEKLPVKVVFTITSHNFLNTREMLSFVKERKVPYNITSEIFASRDGVKQEPSALSLEQYLTVQKIKSDVFGTLSTRRNDSKLPQNQPEKQGDFDSASRIKCKAGIYSSFISWDGKMRPCGSINDLSVDTLSEGYSKAWKTINSICTSSLLPQECMECQYHANCAICPAIRFGGIFGTTCNELHCEFTKGKSELL